MSDPICTLLILTYKGKHHLEHLLPTIESAIEFASNFTLEVEIVDNGCSKETRSWVHDNFPDFAYTFSEKNDYLFSLNEIVERISSPYIFILNDDMKLDPEVLDHLIPVIKADENLFAVGSNILDWEGENETVGVRIMIPKNAWVVTRYLAFQDEQIRYTLFGGGGATVYRTTMFNELGGFSTLYRPAYAEDMDIGHRAWKQGWPSIINPKAILYHREGGTINEQFVSKALEVRINRNVILWMLRNYRKRYFLFKFILLIPFRFIIWMIKQRSMFHSFIKAIPRIPRALIERWNSGEEKLNDEEIINKLNTPYAAEK